MDQRLRLVQASGNRQERRTLDREPIIVPGQIVWKDAKGATRMMSVVTRDISETGVTLDCQGGVAIPLYRLCQFQVDRDARNRLDLPAVLRKSSVLSAIFRVGPVSDATGVPTTYGLRLLVEPERREAAAAWTGQDRATRSA